MNIRPTVINIKDAPEGWRNDPQFVYIGRPVVRKAIKGSCLANPFKVGIGKFSREDAVRTYDRWIRLQVAKSPFMNHQVVTLSGKTLVCWCKPEACHGDVLADLCEELNK